MYKIYLKEDKNKYELNELVKMFLKPEEYEIKNLEISTGIEGDAPCDEKNCFFLPDSVSEKNEAKRLLFDWLSRCTAKRPDWGTLTGVRPTKLAWDFLKKGASMAELQKTLRENYYLSDAKIKLLCDICEVQKTAIPEVPAHSVGLYIGIPFCPTRCLYCSFPSNEAKETRISAYLPALFREIEYTGELLKKRGLFAESVYIGGGTPTTLSAKELAALFSTLHASFDLGGVQEFTLEAGRPDTISREKLLTALEWGVDRISINPQSMQEATLERIGRQHTREQVEEAFSLAREVGIPNVNADLIAGLPGESPQDFEDSLAQILAFSPENITVHTLAVKKASRLIELDSGYHYGQGDAVREMLETASKMLTEKEYFPYYMYRQKNMAGNLENVGYALAGTESLYNVRIMEENQTIVALGAGGISKVYFSPENRLERIPNVSNYEIYIERLEEMLKRKEAGIK